MRAPRYLLLAGIIGLVAIAAIAGLSAHGGPITALELASAPHAVPAGSGGQISGPPGALPGSCSLNPLSWGQCITDVFSSAAKAAKTAANFMNVLIEDAILTMYAEALVAVVAIVVAIGQSIATVMIAVIDGLAFVASLLGVFAIPFMLIGTVSLAAGVYLALAVMRDAPILGAFE